MIHSYPKRLWYVNDFLVPSLVEQGINREDIIVWNDTNREGNLMSCMKSFREVGKEEGETWHLQDDVVICSDFAKKSQEQPEGIVCGFCSAVCKQWREGYQYVDNMWYSFPCIKIPNEIAGECADWFYTYAINKGTFRYWVEARKFDDSFFREFMLQKYRKMQVLNLSPNIVNHIDYMLGGSIANAKLVGNRSAVYWNEPEIVNKLYKDLELYKKHLQI